MNSEQQPAIWDFYKDEHIVREINSMQMNVDIGNIVDDICEVIQLHLGELTKFENILKGIKLDIKNLYYSEDDKKEIFSKVKDVDGKELNVMISFHKEIKEESFGCKLFCMEAYKIYKIDIEMLFTKAGNREAMKKVDSFVDRKVNNFFAQLCRRNQ